MPALFRLRTKSYQMRAMWMRIPGIKGSSKLGMAMVNR